jgi:hypothetical protein
MKILLLLVEIFLARCAVKTVIGLTRHHEISMEFAFG